MSVGFLWDYVCGCFLHITILSFRHFGTCRWCIRWHSSNLFYNYISVEFIGSMLCNQQPRTPTRCSKWLSTQATAGASSLSRSATPRDPGSSHALSVRHQGLSRALLSVLLLPTLTVAASSCLTRSSFAIAATSLPASTATALPAAGDALQMENPLVVLQTLPPKLWCPQSAALLLLPSITMLAMVPYLKIAVTVPTMFQGWV